MRLSLPLVAGILLFLGASPLLAQGTEPDSLPVQEIRLRDGSVLYGRVLQDANPTRVRLLSGDVIEVARERVLSITPALGRVVKGEFWREDPNRTRLFFGPTARGLKKGRGYVAAYELFMPFVGVAITDNVVLAGGTPLFGGFDERPYWLAPKVRVHSGASTDVAVGALVFAVDDESAGVLYGVATRGSSDHSLSVGLGYGFTNGDLADKPVVMVGFEARGSKSMKFISENYVFPGGLGLISFGPRFFGERISADLGLAVIFADGDAVSFPLVNFVYAW
ncbi:MAG TPA: hypothetical protein VLA36_16575 [Longimicrobiales bacterium]|nr:hypothetical protein [Longimicrobiales bacterium]